VTNPGSPVARSFRRAIRDLSAAQKASRGVSLYSRFINRPLGRIFAAASYVLRLSPNQVTATSGVATLLGLVLLVTGNPTVWRGVGVAALLVIGFALDSADGQVARLTGRGSRAGEWLDHVVDAGKLVAVHASVLIVAYRYFSLPIGFLVVPLLFQIVSIVTFVGGELEGHLKKQVAGGEPPRQPSLIRALGLLPADYGVLALSFILAGWHTVFAIVYGLLFLANLGIAGLLLHKWFGNLARLG
jgi:phosphatidylglycerophosphate synthase